MPWKQGERRRAAARGRGGPNKVAWEGLWARTILSCQLRPRQGHCVLPTLPLCCFHALALLTWRVKGDRLWRGAALLLRGIAGIKRGKAVLKDSASRGEGRRQKAARQEAGGGRGQGNHLSPRPPLLPTGTASPPAPPRHASSAWAASPPHLRHTRTGRWWELGDECSRSPRGSQ